jgi:hypothetical protein
MDQSWSKEAILAMISLLVMVLLSGMGMVWKSCMKESDFWRHKWGRIPTNRMFGVSICSVAQG